MNRFEVRWKNFRSLEDTGWISIKPLTVVIGANATGKTSFLAPLLLLKQTIESSDNDLALKTVGDYFNAGSYKNLIWSHDEKKTLELGFRFNRSKLGRKKNSDPIGEAPPGEVSFSFSYSESNDAPLLLKYTVRDIYGRVMLTRTRMKSGRYSIRGLKLQSKGRGFHSVIRTSSPERFIFTAESAFKEKIIQELRAKRRAKTTEGREVKLSVNETENMYLNIVSHIKNYIEKLLKEISYIGPLSDPPKRIYELSGEKPSMVGVRGESTPEILYREKDSEVMEKVDNWMSVFDFGSRLKCNTLADGVFNLTLCKGTQSPEVNIADTGFGLSQVLPLVVQSYYSERKSLIIAEQPEVHLNPRLQSLLADVFCDSVKRGVGVLVETHSEHFMLRLRRMIAEKNISNNDIAIYFVEKEKEKDKSSIRAIPVDDKGHIDPSAWPIGFFEESLRESLGLAAAQAGL